MVAKYVGAEVRKRGTSPRLSSGRRHGRLKLIIGGTILIIVGAARMLTGVQVTTHWTGQPMFSSGLVAAGAFCIFIALIPASWIIEQVRKRPFDR
jgi:hypothetical protein